MNDTTRRIIRWRHDPSRDWCLSLCRLSTQLWIRLDDSVHIPFSVCVCVCVCGSRRRLRIEIFPQLLRSDVSPRRCGQHSDRFSFLLSRSFCVCVCVCVCAVCSVRIWTATSFTGAFERAMCALGNKNGHFCWMTCIDEEASKKRVLFFFLPFLFSPLANRIEKLGENQKKKQTNKTNNQRSIHFWDSIARERRSTFRSRYLGATSKTILSISPSHTHTHTHERDDPTTKKKSDSGAESTW